MIESRNLFRIQSKLTKENKSIPVVSIEKDYILSWILVGIAQSKMYDILCFKGGTALKKFYFNDYRFSEDLDFTLMKDISIEDLEHTLEEVYKLLLDISNIRLSLESNEKHTNNYTFYINYSGPLGADITRRKIKVDFSTNELLTHQPDVRPLKREYEEYTDIPLNIKLQIYPLKEIFIEKYLSILDARRNEPRDVYDLWYLVSKRCLEYDLLEPKIKKKGNHRDISNFDIIEILDKKKKNYENLWVIRLSNQILSLPHFEEVYRELKRYLKSLNESLLDLL